MLPDLVEPVVVVGLDSLDQLGEGAAVTRLHLRKDILVCVAKKENLTLSLDTESGNLVLIKRIMGLALIFTIITGNCRERTFT